MHDIQDSLVAHNNRAFGRGAFRKPTLYKYVNAHKLGVAIDPDNGGEDAFLSRLPCQ